MADSEYPKYLSNRRGATRAVNSKQAEVQAVFDGYKPVAADAPAPAVVENQSGGALPPEPAGNASQADWHAYRVTEGYDEADLEGLGRDALRDLGPLEG